MNHRITLLFFPVLLLLLLSGCQKELSNENEVNDLVITSFSPDSVTPGSEVVIRGSGFSSNAAGVVVTINNDTAQIISTTDSSIVIRIPATATSGNITVSINGQTVTSDLPLTVEETALTILSFNPEAGTEGTEVTIKGTGFSKVVSENTVKVNGTDAEVSSSSDSVLIIKILPGTSSGKISVTVKGQTAVSITDFVIAATPVEAWIQKADFPDSWSSDMEISIANGFALNDKGYFYKAGKLWQYDPQTNTWFPKAGLPSNFKNNYNFCFTVNGKAYIGLGGDAGQELNRTEYREVWEYNPASDAWTRKKDFPGPPRALPFSFSINNTGYVGGGDTASSSLDNYHDFWSYNPEQDEWTKKANFPGTLLTGIPGFSIGDKGYVLEAGSGNSAALFSPSGTSDHLLWQYDPASNEWKQRASLLVNGKQIIWATCFSLGGKAYAALGTDDLDAETDKQDFWQYDPTTNQWTNKPDVGGGYRVFGSSFVVNGKGYVGLGTGNEVAIIHTDLWEYTP